MSLVAVMGGAPEEHLDAPRPDQPLRGRVSVRNLSVTYAGPAAAPAVTDFSLEIAPGEFVCLLGPSGCGKSSVLNAIAGLIRPSDGQIFVDDD